MEQSTISANAQLAFHPVDCGIPCFDHEMVAGIAAYRRHPSQRALDDAPTIWQERDIRLIDYAPESTQRPVLFVPSLINRGYILDLAPGHSMLRFLAMKGIRPLLLDWGWPGDAERRYTLTDYIAGPLERAMVAIGQPLTLVGYCMGGLLTLAAAQRRPDLVRALALLATPWDFHARDPGEADALARLLPLLTSLLETAGTLPVDALQSLFVMMDPTAVAQKYGRFGQSDQQSNRAALFVAMEDWANDGVPLAAPVARECLGNWYGANTPCLGDWTVAGMKVTPQDLRQPCFVAIPTRDRIVLPASAWSLAHCLRAPEIVEPTAGHVGMITGSSPAGLWQPLLGWLRAH